MHHQTGRHVVLKHPAQASRRVVLPYHNKDLKRGTLQGILKQAGLSVKEFLKYL
ncbi:MAG TPA: type II toxin-antitoxin system HicA family toxin [Thermodesulfobacteriota bacterium]|nr:type II toxin-antitoxin system HicA family toxin [Thermodesulfobacteriota bacterium]